jgi:hypothetical protein
MSKPPTIVELRYPPGEGAFVDISSEVVSVSTGRGKSSELADFEAGKATVRLNNHNRAFDPSYGGQFSALVVPAGEIRIISDNVPVFTGLVEDWNLSYSPSGESIATLTASDSFIVLNNRVLDETVVSAERSDERILNILSRPEIDFEVNTDKISIGATNVASATISEGASALTYMQSVTASEAGRLFIDRDGDLVFKSRNDGLYATEFSFTRFNLCTNPSFENNATDWTNVTRSTDEAFIGDASGTFTNATARANFNAEGNSTYRISFYAKAAADTATLDITGLQTIDGSFYESVATKSVELTTEWERQDILLTTSADYIIGRIQLFSAQQVFIDACLIEKSSQLLEYFDGDNAPVDTDTVTNVASWVI